ncbi:tripartite motif-containing 13 isoform X2 [Pygocentrus nattereri]|uniref:Tripartite motif containing 13 n=1 Tax=Pygocentrus nattereri TaxID=42514 RepID=A0AAR2M0P8_PYGNA|nr:tripartite motif-containing 13 isoform X2 [Pygocentrus nattereri]
MTTSVPGKAKAKAQLNSTAPQPERTDPTRSRAAAMELLEEDLTCPICCCLFEDPRVLPCSHSFCRRCLEGALDDGGGNRRRQPSPFKCPTCRKETARDCLASLQVNYALRSVVEKYGEIRALPGMMMTTTSPPPPPAVPSAPHLPPSCRAHRDQPLNIFCATDLRLICGFCATAREHRGHRLCALDEAHERERAAFEELQRGAERWPGTEAALARLDALEAARRRALQAVSRDAERAADYLERAARALEHKRAEIAADFEALKLAVMQSYDPEIGRLRAALEERRRALRVAESLRALSEPLAFLQRMQDFREALRAIDDNAPLLLSARAETDWDPDGAQPLVPAFDVAEWDRVRLGDLDALRGPHEGGALLRNSAPHPASSPTGSFSRALWRLALLLLPLLLLLCACACAPALSFLPTADSLLGDVSACGELVRWLIARATETAERGASLMTELLDTAADFIS